MGGNAIKIGGKSICGRLPRSAYMLLRKLLLSSLSTHVATAAVVYELPNKQSFGDIDILAVIPPAPGAPIAQPPTVGTERRVEEEGNHHLLLFDAKDAGRRGQGIPQLAFGVKDLRYVVRNGNQVSSAVDWEQLLQSAIHSSSCSSSELSQLDAAEEKDQTLISEAIAEAKKDPRVLPFFQVDLIVVDNQQQLDMHMFYLSFSDFGSILGRMANYHGLKFGQQGLFLNLCGNTVDPVSFPTFDPKISFPDHSKVDLSHDPEAICEYFGLNYDVWKTFPEKGENALVNTTVAPTVANQTGGKSSKDTDSYSALFQWLTSSRLFNPEMFLSLNFDHRARAKERPFYGKFLEYIGIDPAAAASKRAFPPCVEEEVKKEDLVIVPAAVGKEDCHGGCSSLDGESDDESPPPLTTEADEHEYQKVNLQPEALKYFNKLSVLSKVTTKRKQQERKGKFQAPQLFDRIEKGTGKTVDGGSRSKVKTDFALFCFGNSANSPSFGAAGIVASNGKVKEEVWNSFLDAHTGREMDAFISMFVASLMQQHAAPRS